MLPNVSYVASRLRKAGSLTYKRADEVSEFQREPGIISGYRHENSSVEQAVISLFKATNETVNFWTHFIPTLYFVWHFAVLASSMPLFVDPYLFPFVCYMFTSCGYPLLSCMAHAFSCLSATATHVGYFLDYAGLSLYSWGVAVLYHGYTLPHELQQSLYLQLYLPVAAANTILATFMACSSRMIDHPVLRKTLRLGAFIIPFIWDSAPLAWRLFTCDHTSDPCRDSSFHHVCQFVAVSIASFFYATHIPERLAPGCFDIIGHSHNLLHLFGIMATNEQLKGSLIDLQGRRETLEEISWTTNPIWATIVTPLLVVVNVLLVVAFTRALNKLISKHTSQPNCSKDE